MKWLGDTTIIKTCYFFRFDNIIFSKSITFLAFIIATSDMNLVALPRVLKRIHINLDIHVSHTYFVLTRRNPQEHTSYKSGTISGSTS